MKVFLRLLLIEAILKTLLLVAVIAVGIWLITQFSVAQETHFASPRGASWPNCPKVPHLNELPKLMRDNPGRYTVGPWTYGNVDQPKRCTEVIDKEQKSPNGLPCRVALECET